MALEMLKPKSYYQRYFNPERIGENVEGNICRTEEDKWGNTIIVLEVGQDENGEPLLTSLPAHKSLQNYYEDLNRGDYIYVELVEIRKGSGNKKDMKIYDVGIDPEKFKEY